MVNIFGRLLYYVISIINKLRTRDHSYITSVAKRARGTGFVFLILEKIAIPTLNLMSTYHERKVSEYNQEPLSGNLDESYIRLLKRLCNL